MESLTTLNQSKEKRISKKEIFLRNTLPNEIKDFFKKTLDAFCTELNHLGNTIYQYPNSLPGIYGKESINDVFALIERSYFGVFNNAIIRSFPNDAVIQEFSVYEDEDTHLGRADYLVHHFYDDNKSMNLLFEGKLTVANWKEYNEDETRAYYRGIYEEVVKYYVAEKKYYNTAPHLVTIIFEWIRDDKLLKEILSEQYKDDNVTDYYFIYYTNVAGLMVYGTIRPQNIDAI